MSLVILPLRYISRFRSHPLYPCFAAISSITAEGSDGGA
jgi:hypothetical protein